MIRTAILDDSAWDREQLKEKIRKYFDKKGLLHEEGTYSGIGTLMMDLEEKKYFDLFFLDMELPDCTGLQAARRIRRYCPEPYIVFVTNHEEYAQQGYEVSAFRYISKNMLDEKLPEALDSLIPKVEQLDRRSYLIEYNDGLDKVLYRNIFYIQKEGKHIFLHHRDGIHKFRKPLQEVYRELNSSEFIYIDKGCIVNINHIISYRLGVLKMRDGIDLRISRARQKEVKNYLLECWRGQMRK